MIRRLEVVFLLALAAALCACDCRAHEHHGHGRDDHDHGGEEHRYGYPRHECARETEFGDQRLACTTNGLVRGSLEYVDGKAIRVFRGIPYAEPPVGERRWKAPVALSRKWPTPLDATRMGALCPPGLQYPDPYGRPISEDCLTINVWAPVREHRDERMPVLYWIHGGAFVEGAPEAFGVGNYSLYAVTHRTIVVAASYRFNALGFFSHGLLLGHSEPEARGVFGLLDQRLGMQWARLNVAAFGGDGERMAIYGQSAGGISVCLQSVTPLNDAPGGRLFQGAISSSGYCYVLPETDNSADTHLVDTLGCQHNLTCLLEAPWQSIAAAVGTSFLSFQPTVGGGNAFLPQQPVTLLAERALARAAGDESVFVPDVYMRGSVADEGTFLLADLYPGLTGIDPNGPAQPTIDYIAMGLANYSADFYYSQLAPLYSTQFNPAVSSPGRGLIQSTNDIMMCSLRRDLAYMSLATEAHGWFFDSAPATAEYPAWVDVFHEADVFYFAKHADGTWVTHLTPAQLELGNKMDAYWNSAVTRYSLTPSSSSSSPRHHDHPHHEGDGDPLRNLPTWLQYNDECRPGNVMHFTAHDEGKGPMRMIPYDSISDHGYYLYRDRCDHLDAIMAAHFGVPALDLSAYLAKRGNRVRKA